MALPIQKRKNSFYLSLSRHLYSPDSIEKSLENFHSLAKKSHSNDKDYTEIKFKTPDIESILEFGNHILSLNR